jgi:hypothetical protein
LPSDEACAECGFRWDVPVDDAVALVVEAPRQLEVLTGDWPGWHRSPAPGVWSPGAYLWHLVDVLRIGTERLWALRLDPEAGLRCWDADALGEVRQYADLSPRVGLEAIEQAATTWTMAASQVNANAVVAHPQFGELTGGDLLSLDPPMR